MALLDIWKSGVAAFKGEHIFAGLAYTGLSIISVFIFLGLLLLLTYILKRFVHKDPLINKAHRTLIYLLTVGGAVVLIMSGLLSVFLPVIPGFVLVIAGLLLLRKYHRWQWLESRLALLKDKVRKERALLRIKREKRRKERLAIKESKLKEKIREKELKEKTEPVIKR